jgi:membrane-associated protein
MGAVFAGDQINYLFGRLLGPRAFGSQGRILNAKNLARARAFYARHGGEAIVLGRFIPLIRSVTPLAAAASGMPYQRFLAFSLPGSCLWAGLYLGLGYFLGNMDAIKGRFGLVLLAVLAATLLPGLLQFLVDKVHARRADPRPGPRGTPPSA